MLVFLAFVAFKYDEKTVVAMSLLIILGQRTYPQQPYGGGYATGWDHVSRNRVEVAVVTINMVYGQQQNKQTQVPNTQQPDKPGFTYASTYGYGQQGKGYDKEWYGSGTGATHTVGLENGCSYVDLIGGPLVNDLLFLAGTNRADYVFQQPEEIRDGGPLTFCDTVSHVVSTFRSELNSLSEFQFVWRPYDDILHQLPDMPRTVLYTSNPTHIGQNPHVFPNDEGRVQMLMDGMSQVYQRSNEDPVRDLGGRYMEYANATHHMSYQPTYGSQIVGSQVPPMTQQVRRRGRGANVGQVNQTDQMEYRPNMPSPTTHIGKFSQFIIPNDEGEELVEESEDDEGGSQDVGSTSSIPIARQKQPRKDAVRLAPREPTRRSQLVKKTSSWVFQKWRRTTKNVRSSTSAEQQQPPEQMAYARADQPGSYIPNRRSIHQQRVGKWVILDDESENWSNDVEEFFVNGDAPFCYSGVFNTPLQLDRRFWGTLLGYTCNEYLTPEHIDGWVGRMMQWRHRQQQTEGASQMHWSILPPRFFTNW
ncbi:hypothetical protein E3N88_10352 [Mikania micrantha]|uniref:Aminotransferase-like plant mobile domain-containing protein n=1 Tax=Mikania micrantha TaxID=192012 RepID=A0A5N6PA89_9ASTR|nr:hypothetical protein E3N88_10352 [Mikania micrantha]